MQNFSTNNQYSVTTMSEPIAHISPDFNQLVGKGKKPRRFTAASIALLSMSLISAQANWVYAGPGVFPFPTTPITLPVIVPPITLPVIIPPVTSPITSPVVPPVVTPVPSTDTNNGTGGGNSDSNSGSSQGSSNSQSSSVSCNDTKPSLAPRLLSALVTGPNKVKLTWTKAGEPTTSYVVSYGLKSGQLLYGNPNAGDKNTTSVEINHLSGKTTYYFRVRANNNCMPGEYSNEVSSSVNGARLSQPAPKFSKNVLSINKTVQTEVNKTTQVNKPAPKIDPINTQGSPETLIDKAFKVINKINPFKFL